MFIPDWAVMIITGMCCRIWDEHGMFDSLSSPHICFQSYVYLAINGTLVSVGYFVTAQYSLERSDWDHKSNPASQPVTSNECCKS